MLGANAQNLQSYAFRDILVIHLFAKLQTKMEKIIKEGHYKDRFLI